MIQEIINRYKRMRTERFLRQTYQYHYAFVGMGQHSLTNLYPVLHHLGVPLKYICVTSERKAKLIEEKFRVKGTNSLDEILNDEDIKGVIVSASPSAHFSIATQVLQSGKSLFIEKPPCRTLKELDTLIALQQQYGSLVAMVGLQKRYAPAVQILKQRLRKERLINYDLHYLTGAYPEGNVLHDLYIHPLDLVCYLFGQPEILVCRQIAKDSFILMLQHPHIIGTLELSTTYSWSTAEESLKICTRSGVYHLSQMESLAFTPNPATILGIPTEKLRLRHETKEILFQRNNFTSILANNQVYTQGYYNEIAAFVEVIEDRCTDNLTPLSSLKPTYNTLFDIQTVIESNGNTHKKPSLSQLS
ncbi:MAG: Gfo/Idh/MocA family oxidoreductase [Prevotella sp.]|nr:Gfo/Idh/MocA family oxidoreductase [Prevotella sp.]